MVALIAFITTWNEFLFAVILTGAETKTMMVLVASYTSGSPTDTCHGEASASVVLGIIPALFVALALQRYLVKGEYLDSIKESFGKTVPGVLIPGGNEYQLRIADMVSRALQKSMTPKEALDQAVEEWDKITKRRGLKKQQELWLQQMAAMNETGITFRPELADK